MIADGGEADIAKAQSQVGGHVLRAGGLSFIVKEGAEMLHGSVEVHHRSTLQRFTTSGVANAAGLHILRVSEVEGKAFPGGHPSEPFQLVA